MLYFFLLFKTHTQNKIFHAAQKDGHVCVCMMAIWLLKNEVAVLYKNRMNNSGPLYIFTAVHNNNNCIEEKGIKRLDRAHPPAGGLL